MKRDLNRVLRPRSIAVLGAGWAQNVIEQCAKMGFSGPVWPVHPTRAELGGLRCVPRLSDLPRAPDAVFVGVNRQATVPVVAELSAMGAGGAVCFATGWGETGARDLQQALVAAAGAMPILGPNCYGFVNYLDGALLWPDQHGGKRVERGVAILSQSSNIAINLTMQARGLALGFIGCVGNAAQIGLADWGRALLEDARITALGLYIEGVDDAVALAELAEAAQGMGKAIIALKSGKTPAAQQAAASHTAALAGGAAASSAYLRQTGIAEVDTLPGLIEALKIAHVHGPTWGRRLCSLSCSGGEAGLAADLAAPKPRDRNRALSFAPPPAAVASALSDQLGPLVTISNPLDYQTFIWGDLARTTQVFATMLSGYDAGIFIIDPPRPDRCDPASFTPAVDAIEAAQALTGKPAFPLASLPENFDEPWAEALVARGVAPLMGLDTAFEALTALQPRPTVPAWRPWPRTIEGARTPVLMDEATAKARLAAAGITVPRGITGPNPQALDATSLNGPFALKGLGFAHKSEQGAVRLNVSDPADQPPMPGAQGYLLEEMVTGGVAEILLGLRRDPVYGATLTLGFGGVTAELLDDTVTLVAPVTGDEILAGLRGLRLWPLLDGYRGRTRGRVAAIVDAALALQALMADTPGLTEIEINPLIVTETTAVAADAVLWEIPQ